MGKIDIIGEDECFVARAANSLTTRQVLYMLQCDPYQTRVSPMPIFLIHPRTGHTGVLKEYVEEMDKGSRFAIECSDGLVDMSRLRVDKTGIYIFKARGIGARL